MVFYFTLFLNTFMIHPTLNRGVISSGFGMRNGMMHEGIDIVQGLGSKIYASYPGIVTIAGTYGGYGNLIEIKSSAGITTRYAHLSQINVRVGQNVNAGQVVGLEGSTGYSTGSHLHFEIRKNGIALDPLPYLKSASTNINQAQSKNKNILLLAIVILYMYKNEII